MVRLIPASALALAAACGPLALAAACGPKALDSAPTTGRGSAAPDRGLPAGPPLVTPGEHMTYSVQLQNVDLATLELAVGEPTELGDKHAIVVQSHAKAVGLVQMLAKVDDTFTSWIDATTGRPLRWATDEFASKGTDKERTNADFAAREGSTIPVTFHMNDDPPKPEPQHVSEPEVWDFNSFLIALRAWEPPAGTHVVAEVMRSRYMWHVEMTARGKTKLATALGTLPARRLDGHTYKLDRSGAKDPESDERDFSIWISDDDGRVPLQIAAKTDYGDVTMAITDYSPGTGKRLRD
jgi:hypothetical protein